MATLADMRTRVYENLYGAYPTDRPFETTLQEALDNSETDIDVLEGADWALGDVGEIVETGERFLVLSVATDTLTVVRGYGSVAATAAATGGLVRKNPRYTQDQVDSALKAVLSSLTAWGVHAFGTTTITLDVNTMAYDLSGTTDIDEANGGVLAVHYDDDSWDYEVGLPFTYRGLADELHLKSYGDNVDGATLNVRYVQSYTFDTDLDTTLAKLLPEHEELVVMGACAKSLGRTISPATQDPGARTDRTVQPGQTSRDGRWFQGEFFIAARAEAGRLAVIRQRNSPGSVRTRRAGRWRS